MGSSIILFVLLGILTLCSVDIDIDRRDNNKKKFVIRLKMIKDF